MPGIPTKTAGTPINRGKARRYNCLCVDDGDRHCFERELNTVGNGGLHAIEIEKAAKEDQGDGGGGSEKKQAGSVAAAGDGPAETVNDAGHGVEAVEPAPARGDERRGVGDGGGKHPELDEEGDDVADVAIQSVERGKPEADATSGEEGGEVEDGVGQAVGGELGEAAEEKSEDEHVEDGLENDPEDADGGLFVAYLDVAPDEEIEELAVGPDFAEANLEESAGRLNADGGGGAGMERERMGWR